MQDMLVMNISFGLHCVICSHLWQVEYFTQNREHSENMIDLLYKKRTGFSHKFWHGCHVIKSHMFPFRLRVIISSFQLLDLQSVSSLRDKSALFPPCQGRLKTSKPICVSLGGQNNQLSWTIAPQHQQPISESRWWYPPHPPHGLLPW